MYFLCRLRDRRPACFTLLFLIVFADRAQLRSWFPSIHETNRNRLDEVGRNQQEFRPKYPTAKAVIMIRTER